jgi:leader peptidase (prepilin peptidase)/N-methyltransferase
MCSTFVPSIGRVKPRGLPRRREPGHNAVMEIAPVIAFGGLLYAGLVVLSVIDARTLRLPDALTLPLIALGLVAAHTLGEPLVLHAFGALIGYAGLVLVEVGYQKLRGRPGLGRGDAKLLAAGGAWCGAIALPLVLLAASLAALMHVLVVGLVTRREIRGDSAMAFGPFLGFGIALIWTLQRIAPAGTALF